MNAGRLFAEFERLSEALNAIPRLRQFVLDVAVLGKLVPHSRAAWTDVTLGSIGAWGSGGTPDRGHSEYYGGAIPWVVIGDLSGGLVTTTAETITEIGLSKSSARLIEPGSVLIAMYGASVGKLGIADVRCATNQAIAHCFPDPFLVERDYLFLLLRSMRAALIQRGRGGAQPNISQAILKSWPVQLPSLDEQQRIVAKVGELIARLDQLDAALVERERRRDGLAAASLRRFRNGSNAEAPSESPNDSEFALRHFEQLATRPDQLAGIRNTILDLAVHGKLNTQNPIREPASSTSTSRPSNDWSESTLGAMCHKITDGTHRTPTYVNSGVPFVSVKDFSGGVLSFATTRFITPIEHRELVKRCDPRKGDVLIGRIGTLGKAVVIDTDREFSLFVSVGLLRPDTSVVTPEYLRLFLNSPLATRAYDRIKVGGGTHTNKLNLGDLKAIQLPLPPLDEQQRIVGKVAELIALCDQLERSLMAVQTRRARLLEAVLAEALAGPIKEEHVLVSSIHAD